MKRAIIVIGVALVAILLSHGSGGAPVSHKVVNIDSITHAKDIQAVQTICDQAHREISGVSEQQCGLAQAATGTQYLCESTAPEAGCWVEFTGYYGYDW